jgi:1,4-dihydroxy-2-naphthoate octaprenyltransferase
MPGCLVSGLLLLNQFPDVDADRGVGRRHLPMLWGRPRAARVLAGLLVGGLAVPMIGVLAGWLPLGTLAAWLTLPLAAAVARGAWRHADDLPELASAMGLNVALNLAAPALMAVGWWAFSGA